MQFIIQVDVMIVLTMSEGKVKAYCALIKYNHLECLMMIIKRQIPVLCKCRHSIQFPDGSEITFEEASCHLL